MHERSDTIGVPLRTVIFHILEPLFLKPQQIKRFNHTICGQRKIKREVPFHLCNIRGAKNNKCTVERNLSKLSQDLASIVT